MKNREYRTLAAIAMAVSLVVGSFGTSVSTVSAKEVQKTEQKAETSVGKAMKDETVYVKIDGSGTVKSVTVSDQLKNVKGESQIQDMSFLSDVKNVKGDETFSKTGDEMVWEGAGQNICYQGTTTKTLPVNVKVSYKLDGKEIGEKELDGKSGHLVIRYQYENTTGEGEQSYTPFLMVTGMIMDDEKFSDITVKNGKLISDGDRNMVVGMGIPKMKEQLGVDDLDIPDYFEVEADVTEYEAVKGITVATNEMFNELETEKLDDLSDLKGVMNELQDASRQLVDGSGELKKGLDTLMESSGTLTGGIDQLAAGGTELKSGVSALTDGSKELAAGNKALADGTGQLLNGTKALSQGAGELNEGLKTAAEKTKNVLLPGVQQLDAGVTQMQNEMSGGVEKLSKGVAELDRGLGTVQQGTAAMHSVINAGTPETGNMSLQKWAEETAGNAAKLAQQIAGAQTQTATMSAEEVANGNGGTDAALEILRSLLNSETSEENKQLIQSAMTQLEADKSARVSAAASLDAQVQEGNSAAQMAQLAAGVAQQAGTVSAIVNQVSGAASKVNDGVNQVKAGTEQLNSEVNDPQNGLAAKVSAGVSQLKQGTSALKNGVDGENGLANGLEQLSAGAAAVSGGSSELSEKMSEADAGAKSAAKGAAQLSEGTKQLKAGAGTLNDGLQALKTGSGALIDGVKQLDDGAGKLNDGMIQFDKDGIQKLVSAFDGDIEGMLDKLNAMLDASKEYKNFSGISSEMDGQVKFVFVTE